MQQFFAQKKLLSGGKLFILRFGASFTTKVFFVKKKWFEELSSSLRDQMRHRSQAKVSIGLYQKEKY